MIDTYQLIEWFDSQVKRIDRLLEEKGYYLYHDMPELYESQLREQRYYYSMTILELTRLANNDKHFPKIEAWEEIINHEFEIDRLDSVAEYWIIHIWKPFKPEEIKKIKKALEVQDE